MNTVSPDASSAPPSGLGSPTGAVTPESLRLATRRPAGRQPVVLLAEDDARMREAVRMLIEMQGCTVIEAADGGQALAFGTAFSGTIDLFVSDAMMPGLTGPQVYEQLLRARPDLPALFVSGYREKEVFPAGALPPGTAFLQKPFTPGQFAQAFERLAPSAASSRLIA
jgi:two-component system cell cycle sensor histidine kinase/response regulator CckA